jgi:hypothetical protein
MGIVVIILALPLVQVGLFSTVWWSGLSRPWLFVVLGTSALYLVVAAVLVKVFGKVAIAGGPAARVEVPFFASLEGRLALGLLAAFVCGCLVLWGLRFLLAKS